MVFKRFSSRGVPPRRREDYIEETSQHPLYQNNQEQYPFTTQQHPDAPQQASQQSPYNQPIQHYQREPQLNIPRQYSEQRVPPQFDQQQPQQQQNNWQDQQQTQGYTTQQQNPISNTYPQQPHQFTATQNQAFVTPNSQDHNSEHLGLWQNQPQNQESQLEGEEQTTSAFAKIIVAILGLTLFSGTLWFGYNWIKQDASEETLLITAEQSPYKVKPADPGGRRILHQDKLIYDAVDPNSMASRSSGVEQLLPSPIEDDYGYEEKTKVKQEKKLVKNEGKKSVKSKPKPVAKSSLFFIKVVSAENEAKLLQKWNNLLNKQKASGFNTVIRKENKSFSLYAGPFLTKKSAKVKAKKLGKDVKVVQLAS